MNIQTGLTSIKGVGEKTAKLFARLHITNVGELLEHYPRDYEKMEAPVSVSALMPGRVCAVKAAVEAGEIHRARYDSYLEMYEELKAKRRY